MNTIYRIVWNVATGRWVVASEFAKGRKKSGANALAVSACALMLAGGSLAVVTPAKASSADGGSIYCPGFSNANQCMAYGPGAYAASSNTSTPSTAFGAGATASANGATAIGAFAQLVAGGAAGAHSSVQPGGVAVGLSAYGNGAGVVAVGQNAYANWDYAVALGNNANANATSALALGANSSASAANSVALGAGSTTTANLTTPGYNPGNSTLSGTASTASGEVSVGSVNNERRVTNVAAGSAVTDAVNVSQLESEDAKVNLQGTTTASALGGGSTYNSVTGAVSAPSYGLTNANSIGGNTGAATDVGMGFSKVDTALGVLNTAVTTANTTANKGFNISADAGATSQNIAPGGSVNFAAGSNATVARSGNTITLGVVNNPTFTGTVTANGGLKVGASQTIDMGGNKVTDVANGTASTDAVNKSQLDALNTVVTKQGTDMATDLGGGAAYNAGTGAVSAPSYTLANANSIGGNTGAATDVGTGFSKVDTALGVLNTAVTTANTTANKGFNISADAGATSQNIAPGGSVNFAAGSNATVARSGNTITLGVVNNPTFTGTVTANGGLKVGASQTVDMGGNKVTDVANGTAATDAVAFGQLTNATQYVKVNSSSGATPTFNGGASDAIAIGAGTVAGLPASVGTSQIAVGVNAKSAGYSTIALGAGATTGQDAIYTNTADLIAIGTSANATYGHSIAIGGHASATPATNGTNGLGYATAIGDTALANQAHATAVGAESSATATNALALGFSANASTTNSVALGTNSTTTANLANAGYNPGSATLSGTASSSYGEVSIGSSGKERRLTNLAAGSAPTDAVNVSQLASEDAKVNLQGTTTASALGGGSTYDSVTGAVSAPSYTLSNANSIGGNTGAATDVGTGFSKVDAALGVLNTAVTTANTTANKGFSISADAGATSQNIAPGGSVNFAAGSNATVARSGNTITVGVVNNPTFTGTVTANGGLKVGASQTVDMGGNKVTNVANGTASTDAVNKSQLDAVAATAGSAMNFTGNDVTAGAVNRTLGQTLAIKGVASTTGTYSGNNLKTVTDPTTGTINVQMADAPTFGGVTVNAGGTGKITGVTAGVADTDAVNMSQLNATNANVAQNTSDIAGNTSSISNLDTRVTTNEGDINTINTTIAGMNGQLADAVMYDTSAHDKVTLGNAGTPVQLTNVKDGGLSAASTDAVNGSQLYATNQQVAQNTGDIAQNTTDIAGNTTSINNLTNEINSGTVGLVQQAAAGENLTVGKDTDGVAVDFADKNGGTRTLKNVTAGVADTDAVNMSQLNATNANVAQNTSDIAGNTSSINSIDARTTTNEGDINTINTTIAGINGQLADAVMYDTSAHDKVTLGNAGTPVQLTNVKDGGLSSTSTDAVNGSQLYATNQQVAQNTGDIATLNTNVAQNTSDIAGNTSSISNLDTRVTTNEGDINTINTTIAGMNGQLADAVMYDSAAHDKVTLGNAGTPVQLTNVKDGGLSSTSTDAVNGAQLYATNQQVAQNTSDIAQNTGDINTINTTIAGMNGQLADAVMYDTAAHDKVTLGNAGTPVQLTNVKDGGLSAASTDAVNGSQLYATNQQVAQNTSDIAGNTASINNLTNEINSGTVGLVQQAAAGANLTVGKDTDGAAVDFAGTAGARKLINVQDGAVAAGSKDAVNGGQLNGVSQSVANAIGGGSTVNSDGSISAPSYDVHNADGSTTTVNNVGDAVTNLDGRVTQNTSDITSLSQTVNNITNGGAGIRYFHANSTQADSVASGTESVAVGGNAKATATNAVAVGSGAQATQANSVALGSGSTTGAVTATTGGTVAGTQYSYAGSAPTGTVSVGSAGSERTVTNVAAGQVSASSTDAVNGSQLYATNQAVDKLDGRVTNVESQVSNLAGAVNNNVNGSSGMFQVSQDSNTQQPTASGSKSTAGGNNAVASGSQSTALGNGSTASADNSVALGANSVADRANSVSVGSAGKERQITNVAAGTADTDAVNVSQLKSAGVINSDGSTNKAVTYDNNTDGTTSVTMNAGGDPTIIHNVAPGQMSSDAATVGQVDSAMQQTANWAKNYTDQQIANTSRQARAGSAAAIAVASLPQAYQPSQNSVGVAFGTYQGQNAVSVGMSAISESGRYIVKVSATGSQHGGAGAGIGAGMVW